MTTRSTFGTAPAPATTPHHPALMASDPELAALIGADAALLMTEWKDYTELDWNGAIRTMRQPLVIDTRNALRCALTTGILEQIGRRGQGQIAAPQVSG